MTDAIMPESMPPLKHSAVGTLDLTLKSIDLIVLSLTPKIESSIDKFLFS